MDSNLSAVGAIGDVPDIADPEIIGQGGFATVYRAVDRLASRPVAVKVLSVRPDDEGLRYFERERVALARLSTHPNVVTLHRTGVTPSGYPYLVMEYAPGGSLAERVRSDGPLPWDEAIRWLLPVVDAVAHMHDEGVHHHDIKPQNILVSAHNQPLLSDFGIASLTVTIDSLPRRPGFTLSYASPEQIEGVGVDARSDVYGLGATLYGLLAGHPAFPANDDGYLAAAHRVMHDPPPPLPSAVPDGVSAIVVSAMAKNPDLRPRLADLGRDLRHQLDRQPAAETPGLQSGVTTPWPGDTEATSALPLGQTPARSGSVLSGDGPGAEDPGSVRSAPAGRRWRRGPVALALASLLVAGVATVAAIMVLSGSTDSADSADGADGLPSAARPPSSTEADDPSAGSAVAVDGTDRLEVSGTVAESTTVPTLPDPDPDDDGILDDDDNCPAIANPGQADVDEDGIGDACDDFPDQDQDGIIDTADPCIELPDAPDADGDGIPDSCDETPQGMAIVAAAVEVRRVSVLNTAYGDGETDLFGDLKVDDTKVQLPEISGRREVRPGNWFTERIPVAEGAPVIRFRVWIRDEDDCFLCRDGLVDLSPVAEADALHLVVDTTTGVIEVADEDWNRVEVVGELSGPTDGDLNASLTLEGDDDTIHRASIELLLTVIRVPVV